MISCFYEILHHNILYVTCAKIEVGDAEQFS